MIACVNDILCKIRCDFGKMLYVYNHRHVMDVNMDNQRDSEFVANHFLERKQERSNQFGLFDY
jgi:(2Fe-2S) ferredoxin